MKKNLLVLLALVPVLFFSCSKDEKDKPKPEPEALEVTTTTLNAEKGNGTLEIPVSSNVQLKVTVSDNAKDWLYYVETKAITESKVVVGYRANPLAKERSGIVTITGTELSASVTVTQAAADPVVSLDIESRTVNPRGMEFTLTPTANDELTVSTTASWLASKGAKDGVYTIEAALNGTGEPREAQVVFAAKTDPTVTASVTVTQKPANTDPNAISILAIGNSFSVDAMEYLYPVLEELGYTKIRLGNLYVPGCSLETHLDNFKGAKAAYVYYTTDENGKWTSTPDVAASTALETDDWDYISLQQNSGNSGVAASYEPLDELIDSVRAYCEYTPLVWHMTWAYAQNSTHADFANYSNDQLEMYGDIVSTVEDKIKGNSEIEKIIPCGTAIQNLRTTFFEDNLTRDGYHLSYNIGRLAAAYTFAAAVTGKSVDNVKTVPLNGEGAEIYKYEDNYLPAIKEAVANAVALPFEVTETADHAPVKSLVPNNELRAVATAAGYDLSNYTEVQLTLIHNAYYNSTASQNSTCAAASPSNIIAAYAGSTAANMANFTATKIFEKGQLPVGTVIVVKEGCSYRPDGWTALGTATASASRPANVSTSIVEINDAWWGSFNYRAFNIQKGGVALDAAGQKELESAVSVFVPKTARGINGENYSTGDWNW